MKSGRRALALLVAVIALALAPAAQGAVDYSKNAAGGDYAPAVTPQPGATATSTDSGFAWGDAAVGAGAALALVLFATGARGGLSALRSRRQAA